jgi:hypothetical protein
MPENQSLIFAVIMFKHVVSLLATLRDQMSLTRASMQPAAQQCKTNSAARGRCLRAF